MSLQGLLFTLEEYCKINQLTLNIEKTKTVVFRKGGPIALTEKWFFNNQLLDNVNNYNYLGLNISTTGSWKLTQDGIGSRYWFSF